MFYPSTSRDIQQSRDVTVRAIFSFEPDNQLLSSDPVYQINRPWEHFICVPRCLLSGKTEFGFHRLIGRKRPSALDHASKPDSSRHRIIGCKNELSRKTQTLTSCCRHPTGTSIAKTYGSPMGYWRPARRRQWGR
jgi:hypothetical protein